MQVVRGKKVESWLRGYVIKSMFGTRFWPAIDSRYIPAAQALNMQDQKAYLTSLTVARARASSQSDFMGVVSIPLFIGLLSIYVMLDLSRELIVFLLWDFDCVHVLLLLLSNTKSAYRSPA